MTDRRMTPANERAALAGWGGPDAAPLQGRTVPGEAARVAVPLADLCASPDGPRDRQLLWGEGVTVIDRHQGWAFLQAARDGYCGYIPEAALGPPRKATHRVTAPATHVYAEARVQARDLAALSCGSLLAVDGVEGSFARTDDGYVPLAHLRAIEAVFTDPVAVAEMFLGTPYLWGGNSRWGLDCSALVQAAWLACGRPCPGDSDLQQALGVALPEAEPLRRGDLIFWRGHVALVVDEARLIHATGHVMATVHEDIAATVARIASQGKPVVARRRP